MTNQEVDETILEFIRNHPAARAGDIECGTVVWQHGRERFRVVDASLQRLRKRGLISFSTKWRADGQMMRPGWKAVR